MCSNAVSRLLIGRRELESACAAEQMKDIHIVVVWQFLLVDAADFGGEVKRENCVCCLAYLLFAVVLSTCHHINFVLSEQMCHVNRSN